MILHILKRVFFVLLGFVLATLASGVVVTIAFLIGESGGTQDRYVTHVPGLFVLICALIGLYAALPAGLAVLVGEVRPVREKLYYMVVGCLIGTGEPLYVGADSYLVPVGFLFGIVAGLIYWRIAGRRAGFAISPA